jgi:acyl-CoA thioesterase
MTDDALTLAKQCAEAMWIDDRASRALGMEVVDIAPGRATLAMTVRETMTNGHGMCHGGYIFTLADSAFAFACNGYNQRTLAQHCSVTFLRPAQLGDRLIAECFERTRAGRSGIYDVSVKRADSTLIAEFRGHSRTIDGTLLAPALHDGNDPRNSGRTRTQGG